MDSDWIEHREIDKPRPYAYTHKPTGIRLIDIKRHPVYAYDPSCGHWNVFAPNKTFPVNAGNGSAAEWKTWITNNIDYCLKP